MTSWPTIVMDKQLDMQSNMSRQARIDFGSNKICRATLSAIPQIL